jgi:hypothetical protein
MRSMPQSSIVVVTACALACALGACLPSSADGEPRAFSDDFERAELGASYIKRGGSWRIVDGALSTLGDRNQPLWLDVPLSKNVRIDFVAWSNSEAVDTKVEVFGDGVRHESGYIVILAGWNNSLSTIARLDEHEKTRVVLKQKWEKGRKYHWTVQRTDGHTLELLIDGERVLAYDDKQPLYGANNNRLAFTSWESEVSYDDLRVTQLP